MLIILAVLQTAQAQCSPSVANIYPFSYNSKNYEIIKENLNWVNASACAVFRGGKLAEINSQSEQDTLFFHINNAGITASNTVAPDGGGASYLWLGGNDLTIEGNWVWDGDNDGTSIQFWQGDYMTGYPVGGLYNNWGDEPDDYNGQDGLGIAFTNWPYGVAGEWNDINVTNALYYVIEYDTNSTTGMQSFDNNNSQPNIYPTPARDKIFLDMSSMQSNEVVVKIFSTDGRMMLQQRVCTADNSVLLSSINAGLYLMTIEAETNKSYFTKFVKAQ